MKKFVGSLLLVVGIVLLSIMLDSCQKEELVPGIVYTDTPPESLFVNGYANTQKIWIESIAEAKKIKGDENVCDGYTNPNTGEWVYRDCGIWRLIPAKKYWGIQGGIIYLSKSTDWYIIKPNDYLSLFEGITKKQTMIAYFWAGGQNPFGITNPMVTGIEYN